jgi:chitinase
MVTVGGWVAGSANFSGVCLTQQSREDFTINSIAFLRKYNFDGLDISWLYPTFREGGRPEDKENFGYLLQVQDNTFWSTP